MATDFSYNEKTVNSGGPIKPSGINQPLDPRTEVKLYADIKLIPNPYIGMIITVLEDETNSNKMTDYKVLSLKADDLGVANSVVDQVQRYADYLGVTTGGTGLTSEQEAKLNSIDNKVDKIDGKGLSTEDFTTEEKTTLANLKTTVGDSSSGLVKDVEDLKTNGVSQDNINTAVSEYLTNNPVSSYNSPIKNKKWACIGDSITEENGRTTKHYHDYIATSTGVNVVNLGYSGTGYTKDYHSYKKIPDRLDEIPLDSDFITIFAGVNDCGGNGATTDLGTIDDANATTFYGGINLTVSRFFEKYPNIPLGIISPLPGGSNVGALQARVDALEAVCKKNYIPFLNLFNTCGFRLNNDTWKANYLPDGLHPNEKGHALITNSILQFIEKLATPIDMTNLDVYGSIISSISSISINKGSSDTFTVKLSKAPTNTQTVNIACNTSGVTVSPTSLTFDSNNYNVEQTITITVSSSCTVTSFDIIMSSDNVSSKTITTTIIDTNTPIELIVNKTSTTITEGESDTFTVKLNKDPMNKTISLTVDNNKVSLSTSTLTFTSSNYNTEQTVTITANNDDDTSDDSSVITLSGDNINSKTINVEIKDKGSSISGSEENLLIYCDASDVSAGSSQSYWSNKVEGSSITQIPLINQASSEFVPSLNDTSLTYGWLGDSFQYALNSTQKQEKITVENISGDFSLIAKIKTHNLSKFYNDGGVKTILSLSNNAGYPLLGFIQEDNGYIHAYGRRPVNGYNLMNEVVYSSPETEAIVGLSYSNSDKKLYFSVNGANVKTMDVDNEYTGIDTLTIATGSYTLPIQIYWFKVYNKAFTSDGLNSMTS